MTNGDRRIRVSVLETERLLSDLLQSAFTAAGMEVVRSCEDVGSFSAFLSGDRPDGAIVDLHFSQPTAQERTLGVLRELKDKYPSIPFVVLASASQPSAESCYGAGASAWVDMTTASRDDLTRAISSACDGTRFFPLTMALSALRHENRTPSVPPLLEQLTTRERQVLSFIGDGSDNLKIAAHLGIGERTVKSHVTNLYRKTGRENRTQLALLARELGLRPSYEPAPSPSSSAGAVSGI